MMQHLPDSGMICKKAGFWCEAHIIELLGKARSIEQVYGPNCLRDILNHEGDYKNEVERCYEPLLQECTTGIYSNYMYPYKE